MDDNCLKFKILRDNFLENSCDITSARRLDSNKFLFGMSNGGLILYDLKMQQWKHIYKNNSAITCISTNQIHTFCLFGDMNGCLRIISINNQKLMCEYKHNCEILECALDFSYNGEKTVRFFYIDMKLQLIKYSVSILWPSISKMYNGSVHSMFLFLDHLLFASGNMFFVVNLSNNCNL